MLADVFSCVCTGFGMFACVSATGAAAHKNNEARRMDVNLLFDPQSLSVHLCALTTMHVKYQYAVLIEFF